MSIYRGDSLELEIWGASHAPEIGARLSGLSANLSFDPILLAAFMARRAPGGTHATRRKEADLVEFRSGVLERGSVLVTDGNPLELVIQNTDIRPQDYKASRSVPRPGHADLAEYYRTGDYIETGGGAHSGRMTAALTAAGGIVLQLLSENDIEITTAIKSIGELVLEEAIDEPSEAIFKIIEDARAQQDSVGGQIELHIKGLKPGIGGPLFDGLESHLARLIFSIPAVKAFEMGDGVKLATMKGSEANDAITLNAEGVPVCETNHMGGLLGGISFGQDLLARVSFKPTPSISRVQKSVDLETGESCELEIKGRHDPCIALRGRPVIEAAASLALYDQIQKKVNS